MKNNIKIYKGKQLTERRVELLNEVLIHDTFLPESILHDDLDKGFLNFVKENFIVNSNGEQIPIIDKLLTVQKWGEFKNTWNLVDNDKNIKLPFIATIRKPDVQPGTNPITQRIIPDIKTFTYLKVRNFDGINENFLIYKIPQPVAVDISFEVSIVCNKFRDTTILNKIIMQKFSSRQSYVNIKGHYIPIILDSNTDTSPIDVLDGRRFYIQNYNFTLLGYLQDSNEFEVVPSISRVILTNELNSTKKFNKVNFKDFYNLYYVDLKPNGNDSSYVIDEKMNKLLFITKNNNLLKLNVDYYNISGSNKINFINKPSVDDDIKIYFYQNKVKNFVDENKTPFNLNEIDLTNLNTNTYNIPNLKEVLLIVKNNIILNKDIDYTVINQNINFNQTLNINDNLKILFLN